MLCGMFLSTIVLPGLITAWFRFTVVHKAGLKHNPFAFIPDDCQQCEGTMTDVTNYDATACHT